MFVSPLLSMEQLEPDRGAKRVHMGRIRCRSPRRDERFRHRCPDLILEAVARREVVERKVTRDVDFLEDLGAKLGPRLGVYREWHPKVLEQGLGRGGTVAAFRQAGDPVRHVVLIITQGHSLLQLFAILLEAQTMVPHGDGLAQ